jgi:DNA polymerase-3 subunit gamma/tau
MGTVSLNLSRKWRSQNFDQIVGQDLAVRILKNSLYLGHFFPVYLFAGQRGCGKTSTARIFAAALNCDLLASFQKDPKKSSIPCLLCPSCIAMRDGNHPDFIEIDAASHTGVDNMRNIIESSSLLPIMGNKRVYLIDEAHMLSKAAFNAALKILEEPPATAVFILATTNPHKIIETVRSRCFQLFFTPIAYNPLKNHLQAICAKENIAYDDQALDIIVRQTEGSARDALNMLEQVRFSSSVVNKVAVLKLLGHMSDQHILDIITMTLSGSATELLALLHTLAIDHYSAEFVWQRLMIVLRSLIWAKYGVSSDRLISCSGMVEDAARHYSLADLQRMVEILYSYEELFMKTTMQHILLEMVLLQICQKDKKKTDGGAGSAPCSPLVGHVALRSSNDDKVNDDDEDDQESDDFSKAALPALGQVSEGGAKSDSEQWTLFINQIVPMNHPIISSLFQQSRLISYDQQQKKICVEFAKDLVLFKDWIDTMRDVWYPLCKKAFATDVLLEAQFTGTNKADQQIKHKEESHRVIHQDVPQRSAVQARPATVQHKDKTAFGGASRIDVSNENEWQMASMLLRHFPGVITEIRENR